MTLRDPAEYSSHISFARICLYAAILSGLALIGLSAITLVPSAYLAVTKAALVLAWILITATIYSIRSFVIAYQCKRRLPQTYDRPCPEYITVATMFLILVTIFWPN